MGARLSHPARTLACQGHRTAPPPPAATAAPAAPLSAAPAVTATAAPEATAAPLVPAAPASAQLLRSLLELLLRSCYAAELPPNRLLAGEQVREYVSK